MPIGRANQFCIVEAIGPIVVTVETISQKSRCVAGLETARVRQIGGAGIIALHLSSFVASVDCFTNALDQSDVPPNVHVTSLVSSPLVKTRFS